MTTTNTNDNKKAMEENQKREFTFATNTNEFVQNTHKTRKNEEDRLQDQSKMITMAILIISSCRTE